MLIKDLDKLLYSNIFPEATIDLSDETYENIMYAQKRQVMVNETDV